MAGWIEIHDGSHRRREPLREGLTRIGRGGDVDVELLSAPAGILHVWGRPPRLLHVEGETPPRRGGQTVEEVDLTGGETIEWGPVRIRFVADPPRAAFVELDGDGAPQTSGTGNDGGTRGTAERRLLAGVLADLGRVDRSVLAAWQRRVLEGQFDADRCASELLAATAPNPEDPQVVERAGRLLRDFVMAPLSRGARGAGRRARRAAKSGLAYLLAQGIALGVYSVVLLLILAFLHRRGFRLDPWLDRLLPGGG